METLGQKIAMGRKKIGYTQEQLAEKMGVTPQSVSKWENDVTSPDISSLPILARLFSTTIDSLLGAESIETDKKVQELTEKEIKNLMFKIKVVSNDGDKVNVQIPYRFIKVAVQTGMNIPQVSDKLKGIDLQDIFTCVESGMLGKIVEVQSADGDLVEIVVEEK